MLAVTIAPVYRLLLGGRPRTIGTDHFSRRQPMPTLRWLHLRPWAGACRHQGPASNHGRALRRTTLLRLERLEDRRLLTHDVHPGDFTVRVFNDVDNGFASDEYHILQDPITGDDPLGLTSNNGRSDVAGARATGQAALTPWDGLKTW